MTLRRIETPTGTRDITRKEGPTGTKKTILIVDDEPLIPRILSRASGLTGYSIETFDDPKAALDRYKQGGIDLVITDRQMPYMDGYELTQAIIAHDPKAKVVMITGMANRKELDSAIDAGCVGVVAKPFDLRTIEQVIIVALQTECAVEPPMGIRLSVLVAADENTGNVAIIALNMAGYKATAAKSAREVGDTIRERDVEVVVIDFAMASFDIALKEIKAIKPDAKIIVIAEREQIAKVEKLEGIVSVIVKPVDNQSWELAVKDATVVNPPQAAPVRKRAMVLVVDDDIDLRESTEIVVSTSGHPTKTAENGREGLEMYQQGGVELVLTDLEMPIMDGLELLRAIKRINPDAKVVVLTAKELGEEEKAEIMAAGALQIVAKPTGLATLERLLADHATI